MELEERRRRLLIASLHAVAHAASLVEDASLLYANGRYSTALALAVMAREEMGRSSLCWWEARAADPASPDFHKQLKRHTDKLRRGIASVPLQDSPDEVARRTEALEHGDAAAFRESMNASIERAREMEVDRSHQRRMRAQYVDLREDLTCVLPSDTTKEECDAYLSTAWADVASLLIRGSGEALQHGVSLPDLAAFSGLLAIIRAS